MLRVLAVLLLVCVSECRNLFHCDTPQPGETIGSDWVERKCEPEKYAWEIVAYGIPLLVVAVFLFICCPVFFLGRYACNCCGGKEPSDGLIFTTDNPSKSYSDTTIMFNKCTVCLVCLIAWLGVGLGIAGMVMLQTGSDDGWDAVDTVALNLTARAGRIQTTLDTVDGLFTEVGTLLNNPTYYSNLVDVGAIGEFKTSVETFRTDVTDVRRDYYDPFSDWSVALTAVLLGIPTICMAAAALFAACSVRQFVQPCILAGTCCTGALLWLVAIFIQLMWVSVTDVCDEVGRGARGEPSIITGLLEENCDQAELDKASNITSKAMRDGARTICETLDVACAGANSTLDCSAKPATSTCVDSASIRALDTTVGWKPQFYAVHTQVGSCTTLNTPLYCPLRTCGSECGECSGIPPAGTPVLGNNYKECVGRQMRDYSRAIDKLATITVTTEDLLATEVTPYMQCTKFRELLVEPFDPPCQDMRKGLLLLWLGTLVVGFAILLFIPTAICGFKRFRSTADAHFFASGPGPVQQQPQVQAAASPHAHYSAPPPPKEVYHPTNASVTSGIDYLDSAGPSVVTPVTTPTAAYYQPAGYQPAYQQAYPQQDGSGTYVYQ